MLKQFLIMLVITAIGLFFAREFGSALHALGSAQFWINNKIASFLPPSHTWRLLCNIITVTVFPILLSLIPAFIYWLVERKEMPKLQEVIWVLWVILLLIFVCYK